MPGSVRVHPAAPDEQIILGETREVLVPELDGIGGEPFEFWLCADPQARNRLALRLADWSVQSGIGTEKGPVHVDEPEQWSLARLFVPDDPMAIHNQRSPSISADKDDGRATEGVFHRVECMNKYRDVHGFVIAVEVLCVDSGLRCVVPIEHIFMLPSNLCEAAPAQHVRVIPVDLPEVNSHLIREVFLERPKAKLKFHFKALSKELDQSPKLYLHGVLAVVEVGYKDWISLADFIEMYARHLQGSNASPRSSKNLVNAIVCKTGSNTSNSGSFEGSFYSCSSRVSMSDDDSSLSNAARNVQNVFKDAAQESFAEKRLEVAQSSASSSSRVSHVVSESSFPLNTESGAVTKSISSVSLEEPRPSAGMSESREDTSHTSSKAPLAECKDAASCDGIRSSGVYRNLRKTFTREARVCVTFQLTGSCRFGDSCNKQHISQNDLSAMSIQMTASTLADLPEYNLTLGEPLFVNVTHVDELLDFFVFFTFGPKNIWCVLEDGLKKRTSRSIQFMQDSLAAEYDPLLEERLTDSCITYEQDVIAGITVAAYVPESRSSAALHGWHRGKLLRRSGTR